MLGALQVKYLSMGYFELNAPSALSQLWVCNVTHRTSALSVLHPALNYVINNLYEPVNQNQLRKLITVNTFCCISLQTTLIRRKNSLT